MSLALCDAHNKFLYEARPDIFPEGFQTVLEAELWSIHFEKKHERQTANAQRK